MDSSGRPWEGQALAPPILNAIPGDTAPVESKILQNQDNKLCAEKGSKEAELRKRLLEAQERAQAKRMRIRHQPVPDAPWVEALDFVVEAARSNSKLLGANSQSSQLPPGNMPVTVDDSDEDTHSAAVSEDNDQEQPGAIEVMCGVAHLTLELQKVGFQAVGIDHKGCKDKPVAKSLWIDLTTRRGQLEFWDIVRSRNIKYVHFAPPCGTASAARNIRRKGIDPKPLRSSEYPDGLPNLEGANQGRVNSANELYKFVARAAEKLEAMGVSWSIENPTNSLMWATSWFADLARKSSDKSEPHHHSTVSFDMCMHGGQRAKKTTFWFGGVIDLSPLQAQCDKSHDHLPWGATGDPADPFATARERNYPRLLCRRIAKRAALAYKIGKPDRTQEDADKNDNLESQPRRSRNELVSEFKERLTYEDVEPHLVQELREWLKAGKPNRRWQDLHLQKGHAVLSIIKDGRSGLSTVEIGCPWFFTKFSNNIGPIEKIQGSLSK